MEKLVIEICMKLLCIYQIKAQQFYTDLVLYQQC